MKLLWPRQLNKMSSQPGKSARRSEIIEVNFQYTALIAMCLGFLFIWSTVVSMIYIKNSLDETRFMQQPLEIFRDQERLGRIMFSIGQEMLFTVDSLVSVQLNLTHPYKLTESVTFTWNLTDDDIASVRGELNNPTSDLIYPLAAIEAKLGLIRSNLSLEYDHPLSMINSYKLIFDIAEQYTIERSLHSGSRIHDSRWYLMKSFAEIQHAPYSLFVKGMSRRFIELAYGTIYHIGPQLLNYTDAETEMANYFYYFYSSHQLIESAFAWDSRIYHRYIELLKTSNNEDLFSSSKLNLYRQSGREYTRFVTVMVTYLLNAKDVLNMSFLEILYQFAQSNNSIRFSVLIASIYLLVLICCTIFFVLFIRKAKIKQEEELIPEVIPAISGPHFNAYATLLPVRQ